MGLYGIDISEYNGDIDFAKVKNSGHGAFVYAKATEGLTITDAKFADYHDDAKAHEIPVGAYHFFHFSDDPIAQANHFLAAINGREGDLLPMVDVESASLDGAPPVDEGVSSLSKFLRAIEASICDGKKMLIYTGYSFWHDAMHSGDAFAGHPLWVAEYNSFASPAVPSGWKDWVLWQFSSEGLAPGIFGNVDFDQLNGFDLSVIRR